MKKKLSIPNVTLIATTSVDINETQLSLRVSAHNINFGKIKLLSSSQPKEKYPDIEYVKIPDIDFDGYNKFIIQDLHKYFNTSHCLIVQADSFVVNSNLWKEDFLKYDYIGAPWPDIMRVKNTSQNKELVLDLKKNPVGNGGFSLRSHKLTKVTSKINYDSLKFPLKSEDIIICNYLYEKMIEQGIHFAPAEIAAKFSMENVDHLYGQDVNSVFGFHGKHLRSYFLKRYALRAPLGEW